MKAKPITSNDLIARVTRAAVVRTILMTMLIQREQYGFGQKRMEEFLRHVSEYSDEYLTYAKGCAGDEMLFRRLERANVKMDQQLKNEMLGAEREADRALIAASRK